MCGRTAISRKVGFYAEQFNVQEVSEEAQNFKPSQNISCGTNIPILVAHGNRRAFQLFYWGISFQNDGKIITTINSRSETVKEKFPKSLYHKRCVLICDGYYEWKEASNKLKEPYFFYFDKTPMLMAAIYDESKTNQSKCFSVLTVDAGSNVSFIHGRQPFLLSNETINKWLHGSSEEIDELISVGIRENNDMIQDVKFHPVHEKMNNTHYQGDDCMKMKKSSAIPICNFFKTSPKKETINSASATTAGKNDETDVVTNFDLKCEQDASNLTPPEVCYPSLVKDDIDGAVSSQASTNAMNVSACDHCLDFVSDLNLYYCRVCDDYIDQVPNSTSVKDAKNKTPASSSSSSPVKSTKKRKADNSPHTTAKITSFFTKKETS